MKKNLLISIAAMVCSGPAIAAPSTPTPLTPTLQSGTDAIMRTIAPDGSIKTEMFSEPEPPAMATAKAKAMADAETFTVTVISDPNEDGKVTSFSGVYFIKSKMVKWPGASYKESGTYNLPAGEYLMQAAYMSGEVIFMEVNISEDMEIHLNPSMADKEITAIFLMPDGSEVMLPGSPDGMNIADGGIHYDLNYKGLGATGNYILDLKGDRLREQSTIRTNVCDEDLTVNYFFSGYSMDYQMINIVISENGGNIINGIVTNSTDNYASYSTEFTHTPAYKDFGEDNTEQNILVQLLNTDGEVMAGMGYLFDFPFEVLVCTRPAEIYGYNTCVLFGDTDLFDYGYGVTAPYMLKDNEGLRYLATNNGSPYSAPDEPRYYYYPENPAFSFYQAPGQVMGSTAPVCVTYSNGYNYPVEFTYLAPAMYYGNFGERRDVDIPLVSTVVKYNGEDVYTGEIDIRQWASEWAVDGHEPGDMTYIMTNTNAEVDGLAALNLCELKYNEAKTDCVPPTIQRVMMRNIDGTVTNRFATSTEGVITLAGGDFIKKTAPVDLGSYVSDFEYYTFEPATVEVSYAPYGENEFSPIEVVEDPEKFFMPGFGAYYEGSLECVNRESATGWYDLKVVMTDEAGNTQSQVISPAFHIDSTVGISSASVAKATFSVKGGKITTTGNNKVEVYNLSGSHIANSNLQPGIYVVRSGANVAKIQVK